MKTERIQKAARATHFNVTLIDCNGSPTTAQIWSPEGEPNEVMSYVLNAINRGDSGDVWYKPLVAVYVHVTLTNETYQFNVGDSFHIAMLMPN